MITRSSKSSLLTLLAIFFALASCSKSETKTSESHLSITYSALEDFSPIEEEGFVPFYNDMDRGVLAVDAAVFKDQFSVAEIIFDQEAGTYDITFTSMTEIDGESTYRIYIANELVGEFQNPETENDFELIPHSVEDITIEKGQIIRVEFNTHSNDKIPEDGGFAYARGRWKGLELIKVN